MSEQGILQGLALGQVGGQNERLEFQFFLYVLFCWSHFLHFFQIGRWERECRSQRGRLMGVKMFLAPNEILII